MVPVLLILLLLLPLAGALLLLFLGKRMGEPLSGYVGTGIAMLTFGLSVATLVAWIYAGASYAWGFGKAPLVEVMRWIPIGAYAGQRTPGFLDAALYADSLTIVMVTMVSLVAAAVHLFSLGYMREDKRYPQFFSYLSLFSFCMIGLLLSGTLLQLLVFWELVGLCSYLLIGFWHEKPEAAAAAIKAFVTNRVGDVGFICGMGLLIAYVGNTTLTDLPIVLARVGAPGEMSTTTLTIIGCLLFCGAMGKSAQFPLQTWLPDAMAGPTPVSALIHAATMVAAGVFLLARIYPILTADARLFILIIGAITIAIGSLCALAQRDIKKALAFSTIAQLGYMVLAIGVGSWGGAMFHLLTHAFFKALLFLCAGTVIHAMHHEHRLEHFGGLFMRLPVAAVTFAIGALAMSGAPYLSGFYSKELILSHAGAWAGLASETGRSGIFQLALWVPVIAAYLTPLYLTRLWMLTFLGKPRDRQLFRHAGEVGVMSFPLVVLAGMAIVSGYSWFPLQAMVETTVRESRGYYSTTQIDPWAARIDPLANIWPTLTEPAEPVLTSSGESTEITEQLRTPIERRVEVATEQAHRLTGWAWLIGMFSGAVIYWRGFTLTDKLARFAPVGWLRHWLANRMYFDELYDLVFVGAAQLFVSAAVTIDRRVIDPLIDRVAIVGTRVGAVTARADDAMVDGVVRGVASGLWQGGYATRLAQGGRIRLYVASAVGAVAVAAIAVVVVMLAR